MKKIMYKEKKIINSTTENSNLFLKPSITKTKLKGMAIKVKTKIMLEKRKEKINEKRHLRIPFTDKKIKYKEKIYEKKEKYITTESFISINNYSLEEIKRIMGIPRNIQLTNNKQNIEIKKTKYDKNDYQQDEMLMEKIKNKEHQIIQQIELNIIEKIKKYSKKTIIKESIKTIANNLNAKKKLIGALLYVNDIETEKIKELKNKQMGTETEEQIKKILKKYPDEKIIRFLEIGVPEVLDGVGILIINKKTEE